MLEIKPNKQWKQFDRIFREEMTDRYRWFLYEFGKRVTRTFLKHLKTEIKSIPGTEDYRKSLVLAEIRDKGKASWFAVVATAKPMAGNDPKESVLIVEARFKRNDDPAFAILEQMGPWTVDTIPFLPSDRQGQVILKKEDPKVVETLREANFANGDKLTSKMIVFGIDFTPRDKVYEELKVIRDIEIQALSIEFGMAQNSKSHWRPSLRWMQRNIVKFGQKDRDLFRVWFDPNFRKYRVQRRLQIRLNKKDLQRIKSFQDKVRVV